MYLALCPAQVGSRIEEVCVVAGNVHVVSALVPGSGILCAERWLVGVRAAVVASCNADEARASLFAWVIAALLHARAVEGVDNCLLQH